MRRLVNNIKEKRYNKQIRRLLRRTLRGRKALTITTARPAASRP